MKSVENLQVAETTLNKNMLQPLTHVLGFEPMKTKQKEPNPINFRPNHDDAAFLEVLRTNLSARLPGIKIDSNKVLRFALRAAAHVLEQGIEIKAS